MGQGAGLDRQYAGHGGDFGVQRRAAAGAEVALDRQAAAASLGIAAQARTFDHEAVGRHQQVDREGTAGLLLAIAAMADRSGQWVEVTGVVDAAAQAAAFDSVHGCSHQWEGVAVAMAGCQSRARRAVCLKQCRAPSSSGQARAQAISVTIRIE
ncbi:hypothetical protein D9M71_698100 [compost metagenome]